MITVSCDICKKKMDDQNNALFPYANHSICEPCKDTLELQVKDNVRNKDPFDFEWYGKMMRDTVGKAVQKGKL